MPTLTAPLIDAPGLQRVGLPSLNFGASPAAGADFTQAIAGQYLTRLVSVFVRLVADANVANREVVVEYRDAGGNRYALAGAPVTYPANSTVDYAFNCFQGQAEWVVDSSVLVPLPPILLLPTHDFRIHVVSVQATDQLSRIRFVWEQFYSDVRVPGRDPSEF